MSNREEGKFVEEEVQFMRVRKDNELSAAWAAIVSAKDEPTKRILARDFIKLKFEHDQFMEWSHDFWRSR